MPVTEPLVEPKTPVAPAQPTREPEPFTQPQRETPSQPSEPNPERIVVPCTPCESKNEEILLADESFSSRQTETEIAKKITALWHKKSQ